MQPPVLSSPALPSPALPYLLYPACLPTELSSPQTDRPTDWLPLRPHLFYAVKALSSLPLQPSSGLLCSHCLPLSHLPSLPPPPLCVSVCCCRCWCQCVGSFRRGKSEYTGPWPGPNPLKDIFYGLSLGLVFAIGFKSWQIKDKADRVHFYQEYERAVRVDDARRDKERKEREAAGEGDEDGQEEEAAEEEEEEAVA